MSEHHVCRGPAAEERWRKQEARGNPRRTIRGKGLFSATGRMRGRAGKANKCNKGRGRALGFLGGAAVRRRCAVPTRPSTALPQRRATGRVTSPGDLLPPGTLSWGGNAPRTPRPTNGAHCLEASKCLISPEPTARSRRRRSIIHRAPWGI